VISGCYETKKHFFGTKKHFFGTKKHFFGTKKHLLIKMCFSYKIIKDNER